MELSQLVSDRFHFKTTVPQWKEKRGLFGDEEKATTEDKVEVRVPPEEVFFVLFKNLDRAYKRLRRKLKRGRKKGEVPYDPKRLKELEEVSKKLEQLESEL